MFNDLLQSKNAPAALILLAAGVLLAVVVPGVSEFPGWAAGVIGLGIGTIAGLIVLQGRGASRDELLMLRTAVKAAQRGERAARSATLSADVAEVFGAVDDVAGEIDARLLKCKESDLLAERLRGELAQRDQQLDAVRDGIARAIDGLGAGLAEQANCIEQLGGSARQAIQVLEATGDDLEQIATRADAGSAAMLGLASESDEMVAGFAALVGHAREAFGAMESLAQELRAFEPSARALLAMIESAVAGQRELERREDDAHVSSPQAAQLAEQLALDAERFAGTIERIKQDLDSAVRDAGTSIAGLAARHHALHENVESIDDLAEQMTLLALNAAIIAAQAGEHGRGFSVVADGMKDLSDRAQVGGKQLTGQVATIGEQIKQASAATERCAAGLERGGSAVGEAVSAMKRAHEAVQRFAVAANSGHRGRGGGSADDALERAVSAAQQLCASVAQSTRDLPAFSGPAEALRGGAGQLERKQHEHTLRGRQLAGQAETIARTLEQLSQQHRTQRRALEDAAPTQERLRELLREHERGLALLSSAADTLHRSAGRNGA